MEESTSSKGCGGWKSPKECPNNEKYDPNSEACKGCEQDALDAMKEAKEGEE